MFNPFEDYDVNVDIDLYGIDTLEESTSSRQQDEEDFYAWLEDEQRCPNYMIDEELPF